MPSPAGATRRRLSGAALDWRRSRLAVPLALGAVGVLLWALAAALGGASVVDGTALGACGGPVHVDGQVWHCRFDDEFSGTAVDTRRWHVLRSSEYGFQAGPECYVDDPQHVRVGGGVLTLTATRSANPCPLSGQGYESGAIASYTGFSQRYGRFAVRAQLVDSPGVDSALWMYPAHPRYGPWPSSGEIDIAETFGLGDSKAWPTIHYRGADGQEVHPGSACRVAQLGHRFHVYAVDWTPRLIRFSYDGKVCFQTRDWQPAAPLTQPQPFDQPFYVVLQLALGAVGTPAAPTPATPLPVSMRVDWVRAWK